MPKITLPNKTASISRRDIPVGFSRRVHFISEKAGDTASVAYGSAAIAKLSRDPVLFDGQAGIWMIETKALAAGSTTMRVSRSSDKASATITINAFSPPAMFVLPGYDKIEGALCRLFLAEGMSPEKSGYSDADVAKSFQWMRRVIETRLKNPTKHMAPAGATVFQIIKAPQQFAGFQGYPNIDQKQQDVIGGLVKIGNDGNDDRQRSFNAHARAALDASTTSTVVADPTSNGMSAWRTAGASPPGGAFRFYKALGGIDFYEYSDPLVA